MSQKSKMSLKSVQVVLQPSIISGKVFKMKMRRAAVVTCLVVVVSSIMGLAGAVSRGGLQSEDSAPPNKVQKCREGCLNKVRG